MYLGENLKEIIGVCYLSLWISVLVDKLTMYCACEWFCFVTTLADSHWRRLECCDVQWRPGDRRRLWRRTMVVSLLRIFSPVW